MYSSSCLGPSLCFCVLIACVLGAIPTQATPLTRVQDYNPDPEYSFSYDVQDAVTGDIKSQQESRQGGVVRGSYSLVEPDGFRRTVQYTADSHHGFRAVIHRAVNTHPVQERPAVLRTSNYKRPVQTPPTYIPVATLPTTPVPTSPRSVADAPDPGIRPAPVSVSRPVLQYIGVRPTHSSAGAPYYQLYLATRPLNA